MVQGVLFADEKEEENHKGIYVIGRGEECKSNIFIKFLSDIRRNVSRRTSAVFCVSHDIQAISKIHEQLGACEEMNG